MFGWKKFLRGVACLVALLMVTLGFHSLEYSITPVAAQEGGASDTGIDLDRLIPPMPEYYDLDGQEAFTIFGKISKFSQPYELAKRLIPFLRKAPRVPGFITILGATSETVGCYHKKDALKSHAFFDKTSLLEAGVIALFNKKELLDGGNLWHCTVDPDSVEETPASAEPTRQSQSVKKGCTHSDTYSAAAGSTITYAFAGVSEKVCTDICNGLPGCTKYRPQEGTISISFGESVIGDVDDIVVYTFYGEAGQVVSVAMDDYYSGIDSYVTLLGPYGQELVDSNDDGGRKNSLIANFTLPARGVYTIIPDAHPGEHGLYTLTLTGAAQPPRIDPPIIDDPLPGFSPPLLPDWVTIDGGNFIMGSSETDIQAAVSECNDSEGRITGQPCQPNWFYSEMPQRTEFVNSFKITPYEITNAQYNVCVNNGPCLRAGRTIAADSTISYDSGFFADTYPVVGVSWNDAYTFCNWVGGRLPTEIEWERAARGRNGYRYPWGNVFESWLANLNTGYPTAVGSYPAGASPDKVMDMAGNVFEWTATPAGSNYVLRGGGWSKYEFRGRTTDRGTQLPASYANYDIGFRCAK